MAPSSSIVPADHSQTGEATPSSPKTSTSTTPEPESAAITSLPTSGPPPDTRRCFVCLVDEPESALPVDWSTPCECSLEGHQECLLAWVTDLEAQGKDVKCPVCKSPIIVTERYDLAIQLSNALNSKFSRWSPRILLGFIASGTLISSSVYGIKAISWFAGPEAAVKFLFQPQNNPLFRMAPRLPAKQSINLNFNLLHFGVLPLIAPALILNRLSVADVVMLPTSLIYATLFDYSTEFLAWPPSPERVIGLYPALKSTYFHLHRAISSRLEKSWAARARMVSAEQGPHTMQDVAPQPEPAAAMNILDLEIDIQIGDAGDADDDAAVAGDNAGVPRNRTTADPINFIAGALLWPGVCYGAGELLRRILPARFVTKPLSGPPTGLLQERWGRSLIGGCLFVVLKDAFFLYVKYKKMMNHPYRRIKNSDRRNVRN